MAHPNMSIKELWGPNERWDESKVKSYFSDSRDVEDILKIYIPRTEKKDEKIWQFTKEDQISTRSAYKILIKDRNQSNSCSSSLNWKCYSKMNLPPKVLLFRWECTNKGIAVKVLRNSKMRVISKLCLLCKNYDETVNHALFHCDHARATWFFSPLSCYLIQLRIMG